MSVNVGSAIAYLDLDISKFTSGIASAKTALGEFVSSTDSLSNRFKNLGTSLSSVGSTMTKTLTVPIVAVGTAVTKVASDFDSAMSKVEAVSGATGDEMDKLREKAIEMGAKTKFSAKESADAFTYMAMAGWDAGQMIDGIAGIMSLAAADGLDLATTSDIVTDALTAFGLQASDSAHFADVLATASSSANTNVSMLGESFKFVAPVAGSLGMSVEDVAVALGLMANAGIKSSQAGTSLRSALTNLVKPTDAMEAVMKNLGIEVLNTDGTMKSLMEILVMLREKFATLSEAEKANAAATLFGKTAMSGMLAIINTGEDEFNKLATAIGNADGRANEMAETMLDNLGGAITLLKSAVESLMIKLGEALAPTIREIAEWITKLVERLNQLSDEQIQQIVKIAAIVAAIGPLLIIVGKVITTIGTIISVGVKLFTGIQTLVTFIGGTLIPAISAIGAPVLIIIGVISALIAVGVALYKNWDTISEAAGRLWDNIKNAVSSALEWIESAFQRWSDRSKEIMGALRNWLSDTWNSVAEFFSNLFNSIGSWFSNIGKAVSDFLSGIVQFASSIYNAFRDLLSSVGEFLSDIFGKIVDWGKSIVSKAAEIGSSFVNGIIGGLKKVGQFFADIMTDILDSVINFIPKMIETGSKLITALWDGMKAVFTALSSWLVDKLSTLFKPVTDLVKKIFDPIKNLFSGVTSLFSGSHANGLDYVPYDGYIAQLHQGERVLTKAENKDYDNPKSGGGDTFIFNSPEPIDEYKAARLMKQTKRELDSDI